MDKEKPRVISIVKNAATELHTYLIIANGYVYNHCYNEELLHIGLLLDKMTEHIDKLNNLFMEDKFDILL